MRSLALILLLLSGSAASAKTPRIASAYTQLDLDRCVRIDKGEEPQSATWRCPGHRRVPLFVQNGDDRYDLDAGVEDSDELWADAFDYPGPTVEWRLANGKPFAIIYRLLITGPGVFQATELMVESVGSAGKPGCRIARIRGATPDANAIARRRADALLTRPTACLKPT
jgi:hypothetical protein